MTTSAAGMLAMLDSTDERVRGAALRRLYPIVDAHWVEIQESLLKIEEMSEENNFQHHALASAIASKCFYHMEVYGDALRHALSSGSHFDTTEKSQYVDTMLSCCIDRYISSRVKSSSSNKASDPGSAGSTAGGGGSAGSDTKQDDEDDDFGELKKSEAHLFTLVPFKNIFIIELVKSYI